jgi:hypothetical protein
MRQIREIHDHRTPEGEMWRWLFIYDHQGD